MSNYVPLCSGWNRKIPKHTDCQDWPRRNRKSEETYNKLRDLVSNQKKLLTMKTPEDGFVT